jgi:hypothetical protein
MTWIEPTGEVMEEEPYEPGWRIVRVYEADLPFIIARISNFTCPFCEQIFLVGKSVLANKFNCRVCKNLIGITDGKPYQAAPDHRQPLEHAMGWCSEDG